MLLSQNSNASSTGHAEGAAGIMGLQKALLVLLNRSAPPNINFTRIRPEVAVDYGSKVVFPLGENMSLVNREGLLWAGVNSFGAGGTNAHGEFADVCAKCHY